mmetsp:Transcript_2787/g.4578  ORF Transcript_2787/g.4578 Transcript_2787/m.4578 type:complete len:270 (-) Transcript_2787:488-1297(-)
MPFLSIIIQPPSTERYRIKSFVDVFVEFFGSFVVHRVYQLIVVLVRNQRKVRTLTIIHHDAFSRTAECLDGEQLTLFHFRLIVCLDDGHCLAAMNDIGTDAVSIQIADTLHRIRFVVVLAFVRLHHLLYLRSNLAQTGIDSHHFHTAIGCRLHCFHQTIVFRIKRQRERTVNDIAVDLHSKINLAEICAAQFCLIARVWCIVRRTVIERASSGKAPASLHWLVLHESHQLARRTLNKLANLYHGQSRFDEVLRGITNLTVHFGGFANIS